MKGRWFGLVGRKVKLFPGHRQLLFLVLARLVKTEEEREWQTEHGCETSSKHPGMYIGVASLLRVHAGNRNVRLTSQIAGESHQNAPKRHRSIA